MYPMPPWLFAVLVMIGAGISLMGIALIGVLAS